MSGRDDACELDRLFFGAGNTVNVFQAAVPGNSTDQYASAGNIKAGSRQVLRTILGTVFAVAG
jgi:hypothetical protein